MEDLQTKNLITIEDDKLILTIEGQLVADHICSELMTDGQKP